MQIAKPFSLLVGLLLAGTSLAEQITIPHEFNSGSPAYSSQVNENFDVLEQESNQQDSRIETLETQSQTFLHTCPASGWSPLDVSCSCPNGARLVTGGVHLSSLAHPNTLLARYPVSTTTWRVRVGNGSDHTDGFINIICAP